MKKMNAIVCPIVLLLAAAASSQEQHHHMPGMQIPPQGEQPKPNQPTHPGPPGSPGMQTPQGALPTIDQQQQVMPQHEMNMEHMEMRSLETTPSHVSDLQEP